MLVMLLGQPRIFYSMSRDGLLPPLFGRVYAKFKTPYVTTAMTGVVVAIVHCQAACVFLFFFTPVPRVAPRRSS